MESKEIRRKIAEVGYSPDRLVDSTGEHYGKYHGAYHATCVGYPPCNPNRMGALTDKIHSIDGFESLTHLLEFLEISFPEHKVERHQTIWIAPLD